MLDELHASRGDWVPRMIHRSDSRLEGAWGRWNDSANKESEYGFEDVVGFWFTGDKSDPAEGMSRIVPSQPVTLLWRQTDE